MSAELSGKQTLNRIVGIATALMCALAAGAVWCVLQLYSRMDLIGLSLLIGAMIAWILRRQGFGKTLGGALLAAVCTALACVYAGYLLAAAKVASFLGIPMRATLTTIGPDLAGAVAWADLTPIHIGTLILAVVLSAWMVWRKA
ncbi:hypothetical protein [Dokdonella sp.]|uniref:hypothetical protein n=1 Tax=Dokdonella sp. TaxID=2291710 RepID=UPI0035283153